MHLQRATAPAREELGDLLPLQVLVLFQVDEQLVVLGAELEFWAAGARCRVRHAGLADGARQTAR